MRHKLGLLALLSCACGDIPPAQHACYAEAAARHTQRIVAECKGYTVATCPHTERLRAVHQEEMVKCR